jgi:hypothetical protein
LWTTPSGLQPSSFVADYVNSIAVRLGKKRFTKPSSEDLMEELENVKR